MHTRFILVEPSHAGNVGAVARAMKVMGFGDLVLVAPRWPNVLQRDEAVQRASGALDVLRAARVVATLDEALVGIDHLCATAMTPRDFGPPTRSPREHLAPLAAQAPRVGFLFGPERYGLPNEVVYRCHVALCIPTDASFGSLNLAAAAQVIAYEWRLALGGFARPPAPPATPPADAVAVAGLLAHWERVLVALDFLDPQAPRKLMPRLNRLVNRARATDEEVHILRGIATAIAKKLSGPGG